MKERLWGEVFKELQSDRRRWRRRRCPFCSREMHAGSLRRAALSSCAVSPSLMGRPLAGSELRGAFISDPQVRPRCLSCQNSPIQHCAEFINAALARTHAHTQEHTHTRRNTHTCRETHAHCKKCSLICSCVRFSFFFLNKLESFC